ncbi:MAG: recombinase family protein, partial [Aeromicrobium sp.]
MDAIYLRISKDRDGLEAGVERQRDDTLANAKAAGIEIPEEMIFQDNDRSASPNSTKPRPQWNLLVEKIEAGEVTRVWAWSTDRLTRRVRENEDIIDLHEKYGVEWQTGSGTDDLSTSTGRASFRNKGVKASEEAERISERVTRQKKQRAAQGKPQGGRTRLYGYTSRWEVVPEEGEIVREAFKRRASG